MPVKSRVNDLPNNRCGMLKNYREEARGYHERPQASSLDQIFAPVRSKRRDRRRSACTVFLLCLAIDLECRAHVPMGFGSRHLVTSKHERRYRSSAAKREQSSRIERETWSDARDRRVTSWQRVDSNYWATNYKMRFRRAATWI